MPLGFRPELITQNPAGVTQSWPDPRTSCRITPVTFNPDEDLLFVQGEFDGVINGIQFTGTNEDIPGLLETNFVGFVGSDLSGPNFPPGAVNASTFLNGNGGPFYRGVPTDDADLNNLLDSHAFRRVDSFGLVTIEGLTVGDDYLIQLIGIADGRPGSQDATASVSYTHLTLPTKA